MREKFSIDEWLSGGCVATTVAMTVGLPALAIIIGILWVWEKTAAGRDQQRDS